MNAEVEELQSKLQQVEEDFAIKRSEFLKLYEHQEKLLESERSRLHGVRADNERLQKLVFNLHDRLDQSQNSVSGDSSCLELQQEIQSLREVMQHAGEEAARFDEDNKRLTKKCCEQEAAIAMLEKTIAAQTENVNKSAVQNSNFQHSNPSHNDLEMYIALLSTQKDELTKQLAELHADKPLTSVASAQTSVTVAPFAKGCDITSLPRDVEEDTEVPFHYCLVEQEISAVKQENELLGLYLKLNLDQQLVVAKITPNSIFDRAGTLTLGDILVAINGYELVRDQVKLAEKETLSVHDYFKTIGTSTIVFKVLKKKSLLSSKVHEFCTTCQKLQSEMSVLNSINNSLDNQLSDTLSAEKEEAAKLVEENEKKVVYLESRLDESEESFKVLRECMLSLKSDCHEEICKLIKSRNTTNKLYLEAKSRADNVLSKYKHFSSLVDVDIEQLDRDLLCDLILKYRTSVASLETEKFINEESLRNEVIQLHKQLDSEDIDKQNIEVSMNSRIEALQKEISQLKACQEENEKLKNEKMDQNYSKIIENLEQTILQEKSDRLILADEYQALRLQHQNLKTQLENSEEVQREFVKLSQNLQMNLEMVQVSQTDVRWQFEEDVHNCNGCSLLFNQKNVKSNCRNCGLIFCNECLKHKVQSGPNKRLASICNVCFSLLKVKSDENVSSSSSRC